mgnify:CR=1 FL=1
MMDMDAHLLIVDDDERIRTLLQKFLMRNGFLVTAARDAAHARRILAGLDFDLIVLDVMMPVKDGFTLAEEIRQTDKKVPIIFLTAKSMKDDKMKGFGAGADDYITKPFSMDELLMRMQAVLRRTLPESGKSKKKEALVVGNFTFDYDRQILAINGEEKRLTTKEADLLNMLCENRYDVLDRNYALNKIWGDDNYFNSRSMDVYIAKLRKYLAPDPEVELVNVHGKGFKLLAKD